MTSVLQVSLPFGGSNQRAELRLPSVAEAISAIESPEGRSESLLYGTRTVEVHDIVAALDGVLPTSEQAGAIARDPAAWSALTAARTGWYEELRDRGRVFAACPRCLRDEVELTLGQLAAMLGVPRWPVADASGDLAMPCLAGRLVATRAEQAARPGEARPAARIRLVFPSAALGLDAPATGGQLARFSSADDLRAWELWAPLDSDPGDERPDWTFDAPGFRAVVRACIALELEGKEPALSPERLEAFPFPDLLFIDEAFALTLATGAPTSAEVECAMCGLRYLPVL